MLKSSNDGETTYASPSLQHMHLHIVQDEGEVASHSLLASQGNVTLHHIIGASLNNLYCYIHSFEPLDMPDLFIVLTHCPLVSRLNFKPEVT